MDEQDRSFLMQQGELLRDIRDELRASRGMMGSGGGGGVSSSGARPGHTFVAAQAAADRTLSGQWDTLGWSNAYKSSFKSTLLGDVAALTGFRRAPQTMTQMEFEGLARQDIFARVGMGASSLLAPAFSANTGAIADEIYQNSGRFIRFGNNAAGVTGTGFDYSSARSLGRQIGMMAIGDLRLSGKDYNTITSLGMSAGQFDQTNGTDDFKSKVRELAAATGDLTRALHMTVQEVGTAMGNMRQLGVTGVGQQRNILMGLGAQAQVAGVSSGEMLQMAGGVASAGMGMGIGANISMPMAGGNLAIVRSLAQGGLVNPSLMAMGGGAAAVGQTISMAQMAYASSRSGMLALMGGAGGGGNTTDAMLRGLGSVSSFEDMVGLDYNKANILGGLQPGQAEAAFRANIETKLGYMGINDLTGKTAQGMAFRFARNAGMDDAAAAIYTNSEFTAAGRRSSDQSRLMSIRAGNLKESQVAYDMYAARTTLPGQIRSAYQTFEGGFANMYNSAMSNFDPSQGDAWTGGGFNRDVGANIMGVSGAGRMSLMDIADAGTRGKLEEENAPVVMKFARKPSAWKSLAIGAGALLVGGALTVATGGLAAGVLGTMAGVGIGSAIGIGAGYGYARALSWASLGDETFDGPEAKTMFDAQKYIRNGKKSDALQLIESNAMKGKAWETITEKFNRDKQSGAEFLEQSNTMLQVAHDNGISVQQAYNAAAAMGINLSDPNAVAFGDMKAVISAGESANINELLHDVPKTGNLATSASTRAQANYISAVLSGDASANNSALRELRAATGSDEAVDKYVAAVKDRAGSTSGREFLATAGRGFEKVGNRVAQSELNRMASAGVSGIRSRLLGGAGGGHRAEIEKELEEFDTGKIDFSSLISNGQTNALAKQNAFGTLAREMASVESDTKLSSMSASQIVDTYHLSEYGIDAKSLGEVIKDPKRQRSIQSVIQNYMAQSMKADTAAAKETPLLTANVLHDAVRILERMDTKLKEAGK